MKTLLLIFLCIAAVAHAEPVIVKTYVLDNRINLKVSFDGDGSDAYIESSEDGGKTWKIASWFGPQYEPLTIIIAYEMRAKSTMFRLRQGSPLN